MDSFDALLAWEDKGSAYFIAHEGQSFRPFAGFRKDWVFHPPGVSPIPTLTEAGYDAPPLIFSVHRNAALARTSGIIIDAQGYAVEPTLGAERFRNPDLKAIEDIRQAPAGGPVRLEAEATAEAEAARITDPVVFAAHGGLSVFGHFLYETVATAVWLLSRPGGGHCPVLLPPSTKPWLRAILLAAGVPDAAIRQVASPNLLLDRVIVSSSTTARQVFRPNAAILHLRDYLLRHVGAARSAATERLYLTRGSSREFFVRQIVNEPQVISIVEKFGFRVVEPSQLPFEDQVRLFAGAEAIVGVHGSAFANALFAPPGCKTIDLLPAHWAPIGGHWIANIANACGHHYGYILCADKKGANFDRLVYVDPAILQEKMTLIFS